MLSLNFMPNITDQSLEVLAPFLLSVSELHLAGTGVTDFGLQQLLFRCRALSLLDVYGCFSLTDLALANVSSLCPTLERLVCSRIG